MGDSTDTAPNEVSRNRYCKYRSANRAAECARDDRKHLAHEFRRTGKRLFECMLQLPANRIRPSVDANESCRLHRLQSSTD